MIQFLNRYGLLVLIVVQCLLCIPSLLYLPIALDEPFSIFHAQQPWEVLWEEIPKGNNPLGHFVLLKIWMSFAGTAPFSLRLFSLLIRVLTLIAMFELGKKILPKKFVFSAILVFIFLRINHYVAVEVRMYGLFTLFFVLILNDFLNLLERKKNARFVYQLGLWNVGLLYVHYLGVLVLGFELLMLILFVKHLDKSVLIHFCLTLIISVVLYYPQLYILYNRINSVGEQGTWVELPLLRDLWINLIKIFNNEFAFYATLLLIVSFAFFKKANPFYFKSWKERFILIWFLLGYFGIFFFSYIYQPFFTIKYLQFLSVPMIFILMIIVKNCLPMQKKEYSVFLFLIPFLLSFKLIPDINRNPDRLVGFVKEEFIKNQTTVYYCPPHYNYELAYHWNSESFNLYSNLEEFLEKENIYAVYDWAEVLENRFGSKRKIYIDFDAKFLYPNNNILEELNANCTFVKSAEFKGDFRVYIYEN
ncbi:glycosyltransferase family 39 protein [Crocinitomix algicola]|uniref:glycosyltransferase family 39 protein n=1 Tax=Crocinitomix algicola TaxID=1740263 RepID=UPI0008720A3C|nr:glycosyltransferase family 39 protein [Crocinitomix algicola]